MKKTVMNHSLAKALMEGAMQHFDDGGMAAPVAPPMAAPTPVTATSSLAGGLGGALLGQNNYSANLAPTQQTDYSGVISDSANNTLAGYGTAQGIQAQQQNLANALLAQSQGQGPNPAQAALNQSTGQNAATEAALMASQRGSGANPGMIARLAAEQGGTLQQQAVGQSATLQAQQQLAAEQNLAQQQANMASGNIAEQGVNEGLFGASAGAQNTQNNTNVNNSSIAQGINAAASQKNSGGLGGLLGGIAGAVTGPLGGLLGLGGASAGAGAATPAGTADFNVYPAGGSPTGNGSTSWAGGGYAKGGKVPDHLQKMAAIYHPKFARGATDFRSGGPVPGRAAVAGNSAKNDTVPAMLSPGEEVIPRSITQAPDAPKKAADFVRHLQEKEKGKGKTGTGYSAVLQSKKSLKDRVERLEKMCMGGAA